MSQQEVSPEPRFEGEVAPAFPIALLESVRSHDRPGEVLEDEQFTDSLPRRLGLTGIVETQIRRYEDARRAGRQVRLDEVAGLIRLVLRRPDADAILREAGQRSARWHSRHSPGWAQRLAHRLPAAFALRSSRRAAQRALRAMRAGSAVEASRPMSIIVHDCMTARLPEGRGCALFTALIEETLLLHTGVAHTVSHSRCIRNGHDVCEWTI